MYTRVVSKHSVFGGSVLAYSLYWGFLGTIEMQTENEC